METKPADQKNMDNRGKPFPARAGGRFSLRNMRLQTRLILLTLVISVPVIALTILILTLRAESFLQEQTNVLVAQENAGLVFKTETWIDMNVSLVQQLAGLEDITSMDPARQQSVLTRTAQAFPYIYLAHTMDLTGMNVARSDAQANKDYSFRDYFQKAAKGDSVAYQVVIGATSNRPALIVSAPIKDAGKIVGVVSIACDLDDISQEVLKSHSTEIEKSFTTFIVDSNDFVVAHPDHAIVSPDPTIVEGGLTNYKDYPPVAALRQGQRGIFEFADQNGKHWLAYLTPLENGWGVISQQESNLAYALIRQFQLLIFLTFAIAAVLLVLVPLFLFRYLLRPMEHLHDTVMAVTVGDLNRTARVERGDEVGQLAEAFNNLTAQLRENITNLEQRVQDRTQALTLSTEVSRRLSTILNMDQLIREVVNEVQRTYNYYHVHIYMLDETREDLTMVGGTGEAGQVMLARKHHIPYGRGLVGRAAETNQPVLVGDTTQDSGWLPNPLLPETKSELAVPISSGDRVLGVLDVQQNVENGLTEMDVDLIRLIANQVAIAIQNAMTYSQTQQMAEREALVATLGQKIQQTTTIDEVLQVAVRELGQALGAQYSSVELHSDMKTPDRKN